MPIHSAYVTPPRSLSHSLSLSLFLCLSFSLSEFIIFCFLSCPLLLLWFEVLDNLQPQFGKALIDAEAGKKIKKRPAKIKRGIKNTSLSAKEICFNFVRLFWPLFAANEEAEGEEEEEPYQQCLLNTSSNYCGSLAWGRLN